MMRRPLTTLLLAATCGVLVLGAGLAVAIEAGVGARMGRGAGVSRMHSWPVRMSAAPNDLTLAEATFREPRRGRRISSGSLKVNVGSPFGDDYLAAALQLSTRGVLRVLVVLVNRPSPLLDPVFVSVGLAFPWGLGAPIVRESADPLSRPVGARAPALCDLALHGAALGDSELRTLRTLGQALAGFNAANTLAQAYDMVCGLPYSSVFKQALTSSAVPVSPTPPESPAPSPVPSPPVGKIPGEGCVPTPGYACPAAFEGTPRAAVLAS
ncbi:MAG TPA: hypothetical protein VK680_15920 [Solirubrobacteraceae bacterium]|jgi:hypothetical protein|nr:hypothetical protein [Solirubrobacteraceae bacterium]